MSLAHFEYPPCILFFSMYSKRSLADNIHPIVLT